MAIRILDATLINQIAAGEVIERPASAIKELVENAIDAGATSIEVTIRDGGRTYIAVTDNGCGLSREDLALAVERHATSKIPNNNLFDILSLGFRGEALPSIGSVSRLRIQSRLADNDTAWQVTVEGGQKSAVEPTAFPLGTRVEIRDLFFATPVRLKFLKSVSNELTHSKDCLNRLALAYPAISFSLSDGEKKLFTYSASSKRLLDVLGQEFNDNSCPVQATRGEMVLQGAISIPTYNRGNAQEQYFFVNGRPVKDKLLATAVRVAYQDFLASDRYPSVVLFLTLPPEEVDINVHPAKTEVRFRDVQIVRGFVINAIKETLQQHGGRTATTIANSVIAAMHSPVTSRPSGGRTSSYAPYTQAKATQPHLSLTPAIAQATQSFQINEPESMPEDYPLGQARAQVHNTYIIAEAKEQLIIVDQHAAHERLVYEKLKEQLAQGPLPRQALLIPEIMTLSSKEADLLVAHLETLATYGLIIEAFGPQAVVVREIPALLGVIDVKPLVHAIIHELEETETPQLLHAHLHEILASHGCHNSIRAGRRLSFEEMNALLRDMERTPHAGQCNHGRPTYVALERRDIERLFGRR